MASKYQKRHYEDVARVLHHARAHEPRIGTGEFTAIGQAIVDFADLFAADNPLGCAECGRLLTASPKPCTVVEGHRFTWGFNREQFLKACGLGEN